MATYFKDNHQGYTSKPVGNVEIDWQHPLAPDNCYINSQSQQPRNIAKKEWPDFTGSLSGIVSTPIGPLGTFADDTSISTSLTVNPPFTLHARFYRQGNVNTTLDSLFGFWSTAGDQLEIRVGGYYYEFRGRYNYGSIAALSLDGGVNLGAAEHNKQNDIIIVCNADGDWEGWLYVDGKLQDSTTNATAIGGFSTYNRMSFGAPITYGDGAPVVIGNHWNRSLSISEINSLVRNPYAFLKPAVPDYYALGAANDAGLTITADHASAGAVVNQPVISAENLLTADHVASSAQVFTPAVASEILLVADYHTGNAVVYAPSLTQSGVSQTITADFVASSATIHAATVARELLLVADYVTGSNTIYAPSVSRELLLAADYVSTGQQIYQPIAAIEIILSADAVASGAAIYSPVAVTSAQFLYAPYLTSSASVGDPTIRYKGWLNSALGGQTWADVANSDNAYVDSVVNGKTWS